MTAPKSPARAVTPGELKALVRLLVKAVGGVEAAGIILERSAQRVGQMQDVNAPDQMTALQISALEAVAGRAIVTGAMARAAEGEGPAETIGVSGVQTVCASAELLQRIHEMDADGQRTEAEKRAVRTAAQANLREAQEAADAAARL